jgi:hypothetical protein
MDEVHDEIKDIDSQPIASNPPEGQERRPREAFAA